MSCGYRIALFGGTFDPPHLGHVRLAEAAREAVGLDEVRLLPCRVSPHKTGSEPTAAADRLAMLRLATAGLPWVVVDDCEVGREGPSYSYQTAEALAARFPEAKLFWLMGADQWDALPDWRHPERLAADAARRVSDAGVRGHPSGQRLRDPRGAGTRRNEPPVAGSGGQRVDRGARALPYAIAMPALRKAEEHGRAAHAPLF